MWIYKDTEITSIDQVPEGAIGFCYLMINSETGRKYVGKKQLYSERRTRINKKEKTETNTRKQFKIVRKESDWIIYNSSCKEIQEEYKKGVIFNRFIIQWCFSKRELTNTEVKLQFNNNVLESDEWYNENILTKFFKGKIT